ncbi:hypothetical protein AVEN_246038-1 [Araneus ventricosus]|uniref:Uncharacterized protein n=1 Tax=Araneus ventricosus TaxID=182803 RepID=A0A4Y2JS71_ARAVE|nr:hypothetical protein AVEN_246038-1 [Araneus ventricosus]
MEADFWPQHPIVVAQVDRVQNKALRLITLAACSTPITALEIQTDTPSTLAIIEHRQHPKSVMVWGGICASSKTPLVFVDDGVKINHKVYRQDILEAVVLLQA